MDHTLPRLAMLVILGLPCACARGGEADPSDNDGRPSAYDLVFVSLDNGVPIEASAPGRDSRADCSRLPDQGTPPRDSGQIVPQRCSPWSGSWTFSTPVAVSELNSEVADVEPYLTRDELTIYFCSSRVGYQSDIYVANRASRADPFSNIQPYTSLNTDQNEARFAVTLDGLTAFIATDRPGGRGGSDLWMASRQVASSTPWASAEFQPLAGINTTDDEFDAYPSGDGLELYFEAQGAAFARLLVARRSSRAAAFSAPVVAPGAETTAREANPAISEDGLVMLFNSNRPGGQGHTDIWYMTRTSTTASFSAAQPLTALNSSSQEGEIYLTPDGCTIYFASDRPGGKGSLDLYRSEFVRLQ